MNAVNSINKVKLKRGTGKALARMFSVSETTVSLAASGINNSELAQRIRKAAVELGGDAIYGKKKQIKI
jgi:hypothetical protein